MPGCSDDGSSTTRTIAISLKNSTMRRRTERLAELVRRELGRILSGGLGDPRIGFVTLTRVEVSPDLTLAKVYLSVLDSPAKERTTLQGLNSAKRRIRGELGEALKLRRMPELAFFADPGIKQSIRISGILTDLERERSQVPAGPEEAPAPDDTKEPESDGD
jgi:ribosome-binding factor A